MARIDQTFADICRQVLEQGREYENKRRSVKRLQIPSYTLRHSFSDGFPALTNKRLAWKSVVAELIWFLRGDNDVKYLNDNGVKIWNPDAYNWHVKTEGENALTEEEFHKRGKGSVGRNYSVQWRGYQGYSTLGHTSSRGIINTSSWPVEIDQIRALIEEMERDIMSSRLKVTAWNPAELDDTALPPCHDGFQVIGVPLENGEFGFELHWNQRSVDLFLGLPFNIASYALLAKILERLTGYKALGIEGTLKCVHFYDNAYDAALEILSRDVTKHSNCELEIVNDRSFVKYERRMFPYTLDTLFAELNISDFALKGYSSDEAIKVEMIAPKQL
jgi:thymidylate synthase